MLLCACGVAITAGGGLATDARFNGCWERTRAQPRENIVQFCFSDDGTIAGSFFEATGEAGDFEIRWRVRASTIIFDDEEQCRFEYRTIPRALMLSDCGYPAEWQFKGAP